MDIAKELKEIVEKAKAVKKGAFVHIEYYSNPHTLKNGKDKNIVKKSQGVYRLGLDYSNLKVNENKVLTGELNGKEWAEEGNYLLKSVGKDGNEKLMLRVYTTDVKTKSVYYMDGKETSKDELVSMGYVSGATNSKATPCFDIQVKNIIAIGC